MERHSSPIRGFFDTGARYHTRLCQRAREIAQLDGRPDEVPTEADHTRAREELIDHLANLLGDGTPG